MVYLSKNFCSKFIYHDYNNLLTTDFKIEKIQEFMWKKND